jgi:hypothetical protein
MPLIDLITNLKSLTYGEFGSSEPLVIKDINKNPSLNGIELQGAKRIDDLTRISKLLTQTPAALKFASNQTALGIVEQGIKNPDGKFGKKLLGGAVGAATKLASTLAQVPVSGTGLHFVEGFAGKKGYLNDVRGHVEYKNNAPGGLYSNGVSNIGLEKGKLEDSTDTNKRGKILQTYTDKFIDGERQLFIPDKNAADTNVSSIPDYETPEQLNKQTKGEAYKLLYVDTKKRGNRGFSQDPLKFASPGEKVLSVKVFGKEEYKFVTDGITGSPPMVGDLSSRVTIIDEFESGLSGKDLIDFNFKVITPRTGKNDNSKVTYLQFRAFIDSFDDSFSGTWNPHNFVGRAENFYTYGGFDRTINISFKVAALSKNELLPLYQKLNFLTGTTAPTYVGGGYMRGQFVAVTVGDYLKQQTGIIESVDLAWNTDYIWHTEGMDEHQETEASKEETEKTKQLPTVLDVSLSFKPIHQKIPQFGSEFIGGATTIFKAFDENEVLEPLPSTDK